MVDNKKGRHHILRTQSKYGSITSLAVSDDQIILVVGFESGAIAAQDMAKDSALKYFEGIH